MEDAAQLLRFVVLGDSLAYGTGARSPEDGLGPRLADELVSDGHEVDLHVVAVPGATSDDLAVQVRRALPLQPDLALIVIGANDLARLVPPSHAARALGAAVTALRAAGADVVVAPAPDLSSVPGVPPAFRPALREACLQFQETQSAAGRAAGGVVVPAAAELARLFAADPDLFSSDRYHPSSDGYARIAAALAPVVVAVAQTRRGAAA